MKSSRLASNAKVAVYGAAAVLIGGLVGFGTGAAGIVAMIAALGMLVVVYRTPTALTASRGLLMLALGGLAGVVLVIGLLGRLGSIGLMLANAVIPTIFYLVAVGGGVAMAWAGWHEFQAPSPIGAICHPDPNGGPDTATPGTEPRPPA